MGQNGCRPGDLAVAVWDANPGAIPGKAPKPLAATSPGGRLEDRHIPGGRQPPGPGQRGSDRGTRTGNPEDKP